MSYNKFLWTGESVFCICGHHIEYHKTRQSALAIRFDRDDDFIYFTCNYEENEEKICPCKHFIAYKREWEDEE